MAKHAQDPDAELALRALARLLAPYLAAELQRITPDQIAPQALSSDYDERTCAHFVAELGDGVVNRALILFEALAAEGRINSLSLAERLDVSPPMLGAVLTTPIKRRAKTLGLPWPFDGGQGDKDYGAIANPRPGDDPGRTYWEDRDGIGARMLKALKLEVVSRTGCPGTPRTRKGDTDT